MGETAQTLAAIFAVFVLLPVVILLVRDRTGRRSKESIEDYSKRFEVRLVNPDFTAVERHFGRPLPDSVRTLYANRNELAMGDFEVAATVEAPEDARWYIAFYEPADFETVANAWPGTEQYFAFANDGSGNGYLVDPGEEDPPVLYHDHETGEMSSVCDRFSVFMKWPRFEVEE